MTVKSLILLISLVGVLCFEGSIVIGNYTVSYTRSGQLKVSSDGTSTDRCGKMEPKNSSVYHMQVRSGLSILEQWMDSSNDTLRGADSSWNLSYNTLTYGGDYNSYWVIVFDSDAWRMISYTDIHNQASPPTLPQNPAIQPIDMFVWGSQNFLYGRNGPNNFGVYTDFQLPIVQNPVFPVGGGNAVFNHDYTMLISCSQFSQVLLINVSNWSILGWINQTITTTANLTNNIALSPDSTLALIETDTFHPLTIFNTVNLSTQGQYSFSQIVDRTSFLTNSLVVITTSSSLYVLDTETGTISLMHTLTSTPITSAWDHNKDSLYLCSNNLIEVIRVSSGPAPYNPLTDPKVVLSIQMSQSQQQATEAVASGLSSTSSFIDKVILVALSNPFTYYFLTFINFFTISSHYVLIDMPLPSDLYSYLSTFFIQINTNAIARLWKIPFGALTKQKVSREKLKYIGVTTDLAVGQTTNFLMAIFNIMFFKCLSLFVRRLRKDRFIRRALYQPMADIICGQYVALIMPLTSPWVFFIISSTNVGMGKFNCILHFTFFGLNIMFMFFFFIQVNEKSTKKQQMASDSTINFQPKLLHNNNSTIAKQTSSAYQGKRSGPRTIELAEFKKKHKRPGDLQEKTNKNDKYKVHKHNPTPSMLPIMQEGAQTSNYMSSSSQKNNHKTFQALDSWYIVFCNFIYPLILVISQVDIALILLLMVSLGGVAIAFNFKKHRANKIVLACWPVLFHLCFIIFRITVHNKALVFTQMICMSILLLGSIHHVLTMVFVLLRKVIRRCRTGNTQSISPQPDILMTENPKVKDEVQQTVSGTHSKSLVQRSKSKSKSKRRRRPHYCCDQDQNGKSIRDCSLVKSVRFKKEKSNKKGLKMVDSPRKT